LIAVVDYGMGNLRSVEKAFKKIGANVVITSKPEDVKNASAVVLPGVGAFRDCINNLQALGLMDAVVESIEQGKPYLGICLGLQVLFEESEEFGKTKGLGLLQGKVVRFPPHKVKIPHMGWNQVHLKKHTKIFEGIDSGSFFYFVHSYYVAPVDNNTVVATTDYGVDFVSAVEKDNIIAVQFHPEKSQSIGLKLIKNFVSSLNESNF